MSNIEKFITICGKSLIATKLGEVLKVNDTFKIKMVEDCPKEKIDGIILCFIDDISFEELRKYSQIINDSQNDTIFLSTYTTRQIIVGSTYINSSTSCIDSVLYYLLYKKYHFTSDEEVQNIKLPKFDDVLKATFYNKKLFDISVRVIAEVDSFFEENQFFNYINKVELYNIKTGKITEDFIYPIFGRNLKSGSLGSSESFKVNFSDLLNSKNNQSVTLPEI